MAFGAGWRTLRDVTADGSIAWRPVARAKWPGRSGPGEAALRAEETKAGRAERVSFPPSLAADTVAQ